MDDSNLFESAGLTARLQTYSAHVRHPPHAHDRASIGVLLGGSLSERVGRSAQHGGLGAIIVKPASVVHEDEFGGSGTIILSLSGSSVDAVAARDWEWRSGGRAIGDAFAAVAYARAARKLACEEALYLFLSKLGAARALPDRAKKKPSWLEAAKAILRDEASSIRICDLAARLGLHPVYVTRAFRQHLGMSVSGYVRRAKIAQAAELLRASDQRVCDIAADLGFFDQSHLCRAFNAECGTSPSAYRRVLARRS